MLERLRERSPRVAGALLWLLAGLVTVACFAYQDTTGPTYPLEGSVDTPAGSVAYFCMRSETIGRDLAVVLLEPVPTGVRGGWVEYRRYASHDDWSRLELARGSFPYSRRGRHGTLAGLGAALPSLTERAGKYEYQVLVDVGAGEPLSLTGDRLVRARYKAAVPSWALALHILAIFASLTLAARTVLEVVAGGDGRTLMWATIVSLLLGGFAFGPLVQYHAFGVWWSGVPFGYDWTDNKVLVELAAWLAAAWFNRGGRRHRPAVVVAGLVTALVYFIPHSVFGSEFDYRTGSGHGTAG